jgi:hypothetical protein
MVKFRRADSVRPPSNPTVRTQVPRAGSPAVVQRRSLAAFRSVGLGESRKIGGVGNKSGGTFVPSSCLAGAPHPTVGRTSPFGTAADGRSRKATPALENPSVWGRASSGPGWPHPTRPRGLVPLVAASQLRLTQIELVVAHVVRGGSAAPRNTRHRWLGRTSAPGSPNACAGRGASPGLWARNWHGCRVSAAPVAPSCEPCPSSVLVVFGALS